MLVYQNIKQDKDDLAVTVLALELCIQVNDLCIIQ